MKLPAVKIPLEKIKLEKIKISKKETLSFLSYALGVTEKPGPFAALSIGHRSLKLVEVLVEEGKREVLGYWFKEISIKEDLAEELRQKELQKNALSFLKECPISARRIHLGFGGDVIYTKKVTVPEMPKEELPQALRWAVRSQLPFDVERALFEFEILSTVAKKQEVVVAAAREGLLSEWVLAIQEAGYQVASITSNSLSLLTWMRKGEILSGTDPIALLDIGTLRTSLYISVHGKLSFMRELDIGGEAITQALTRPLATEKGELRLGYEEAEQLKRSYGFPVEGQISAEKVNASQIVSLMRPLLERLASEIKRSFDYYQEEFEGRVQKVYLIGGSSHLKHLTNFLSEKLVLSAETLPFPTGFLWQATKVNEKDLRERFPLVAPALGLAFQEGQGLNLLPSRFRVKKSQKIERIAMRISTIVIVFILLVISSYRWKEVGSLEKEYALSQSSWKTVQEIESMKQTLGERKRVIAKIKEGHPYVLEVFGEISNLLPPYAVLDKITQPRGTNEIRFSGTVFGLHDKSTEASLGELISGFEKSPYFKEVKLVSSQRDETYDRPASNFEILCWLKVH